MRGVVVECARPLCVPWRGSTASHHVTGGSTPGIETQHPARRTVAMADSTSSAAALASASAACTRFESLR
jgi:hypothetical protein